MQRPIDFSKMTLEELTPIVSMRPGKEYSREEIQKARKAFMEALGMTGSPTTDTSAEEPGPESVSAEAPAPVSENDAAPCEAVEADIVPREESAPTFEEEETAPAGEMETDAPAPAEDDESFVLENESRLARFLYLLYVYAFVPILAIESLIFLVSTTLLAVRSPETPYLILHIFGAAFYAMFIATSWHQILHRTKPGLFLNRSLIGVCIFRGISMLFSGASALTGILFLSVSFLFLIFFVGYDSTFIIHSRD